MRDRLTKSKLGMAFSGKMRAALFLAGQSHKRSLLLAAKRVWGEKKTQALRGGHKRRECLPSQTQKVPASSLCCLRVFFLQRVPFQHGFQTGKSPFVDSPCVLTQRRLVVAQLQWGNVNHLTLGFPTIPRRIICCFQVPWGERKIPWVSFSETCLNPGTAHARFQEIARTR